MVYIGKMRQAVYYFGKKSCQTTAEWFGNLLEPNVHKAKWFGAGGLRGEKVVKGPRKGIAIRERVVKTGDFSTGKNCWGICK